MITPQQSLLPHSYAACFFCPFRSFACFSQSQSFFIYIYCERGRKSRTLRKLYSSTPLLLKVEPEGCHPIRLECQGLDAVAYLKARFSTVPFIPAIKWLATTVMPLWGWLRIVSIACASLENHLLLLLLCYCVFKNHLLLCL